MHGIHDASMLSYPATKIAEVQDHLLRVEDGSVQPVDRWLHDVYGVLERRQSGPAKDDTNHPIRQMVHKSERQ